MPCFRTLCVCTVCLCFGCTRVPLKMDTSVPVDVKCRINKDIAYRNEGCANELISEAIQKLLQKQLTADAAVQIALLNNPRIQEMFEEIGIAQADLVNAGLFSNPVFDIIFRYSGKKELKTNIEYTVTSSFIDLFLIPLRLKAATADLEKITLKVSHEILDLAFDVEQAFYELQFAQQNAEYLQASAELLSILSQIAARQHSVGNINVLDYQLTWSRSLDARLEVAKNENEIIRLNEKLTRLLGFCTDFQVNLSDLQTNVDYQTISIKSLECLALNERLDLQAARFDVRRLSRMLGIKQWWVYTQGRIGAGGERELEGRNVLGPAFSGEIPIFNYGQADRMRLQADLQKAQDYLAALEIRALSETREAHKLLMSLLAMINEYREQIIPAQIEIIASSEKLYNVMGVGVNTLLEHKRQEYLVYSGYLMFLKNYWLARVQLDRALGGKLYRVYQADEFALDQNGVVE